MKQCPTIEFFETVVGHRHCTRNPWFLMLFGEGTFGSKLVDINKEYRFELMLHLFYYTSSLVKELMFSSGNFGIPRCTHSLKKVLSLVAPIQYTIKIWL